MSIIAERVKLWHNISFLMTMFLNVAVYSSYRDPTPGQTAEGGTGEEMRERLYSPIFFNKYEDYDIDRTTSIFKACGAVVVVCAGIMVFCLVLKKVPLMIKRVFFEKNNTKIGDGKERMGLIKRLIMLAFDLLAVVILFLKDIKLVYYVSYLLAALFGTLIHPFFFAFHLTDIMVRYPTLTAVVRAFWEPRTALFLTLVLFILVTYIFSLIGFTFFTSDYSGMCDSTIICLVGTFDLSFTVSCCWRFDLSFFDFRIMVVSEVILMRHMLELIMANMKVSQFGLSLVFIEPV
jgi:inositol 1,4,5-triphosphate receptor type 1/inositol 1,4,5-triphosphate receptor type 3